MNDLALVGDRHLTGAGKLNGDILKLGGGQFRSRENTAGNSVASELDI